MAALTQLWNLLKLLAPFIGVILVVAIGLFIIALTLVIVIVTAVILIITGLIHIITGLVSGVSSAASTMISTMGHWKDQLGTFIGNVVQWFKDLPGKVSTALSNFGTMVKGIFDTAASKAATAVTNGITTIVGDFGKVAGRVLNALSGMGNMGQWMANWIQSAANAAWNNIQSLIDPFQHAADVISWLLAHMSPPKGGPLKDDDQWIPNMIRMMAEGANREMPKLIMAFNTGAQDISGSMSSVPSIANYGYGGYGNMGGNITIPVTIDGRVITEVVVNRITGQLQSNGMSRAFR
jgi:phage-related protein